MAARGNGLRDGGVHVTPLSDMDKFALSWDTVFGAMPAFGLTRETFARLCHLLWVESSSEGTGTAPVREILWNTLSKDVEEAFFQTFQTLNEADCSRRFMSVGNPDWMVVVESYRDGFPLRLLGGVINTTFLEQDSTFPSEIKNFLVSPDVRNHELLIWLLFHAYRFQKEEFLCAKAHAEQLLNERAALKESHAEAVARAIAEREERIREQEEYYRQIRAVMTKAADGILTVNPSGLIDSTNEAAEQMFGYSADEILAQPVETLLLIRQGLDPTKSFPEAILSQVRQDGQSVFETQGLKKDGTLVDLELSVSRVVLEHEPFYVFILRDITVRKRLEEQERQIHLLKQTILNAAADGIVGIDQEGRVIFVNPAATSMLGFSQDELVGRVFHEVVHHSHPNGTPYPVEQCPLYQAGKDASPSRTLTEEVFWRKDNTNFPVECTSQPICEGDRITGRVITFRDISLRRWLEAQLRQAQKMESMGQLAAGIAHEINTPTQYIGDNICFVRETFAELSPLITICAELRTNLLNGDGDTGPKIEELFAVLKTTDVDYIREEIPQALSEAMEGVNSVANIVKSMREFSHPGAEAKQSVDFNRCVENTVTVSKNEWKYVADMKLDLEPNLPPVSCSPNEMNQVLLNLIINAAHAIGEKLGQRPAKKGLITISTRQMGDLLEVRVQDTGTGIPEAIRSRIFDPFFTTKPVGKGTGQGLAIVHSIIVKKHHGTIDFETTPGEGTTFIIRIPFVEPKTADHPEDTETVIPAP